jgi:NADH-quinone oxidoreductase subunit N
LSQDLINSVSGFLPEIVLVLTILLIPLNKVLFEKLKIQAGMIAISGLGISFILSVVQIFSLPTRIFGAMSVLDPLSTLANIAVSFASLLIVLITLKTDADKSSEVERYVFITALALGCMLLASSVNLVMLFVSVALIDTSLVLLMNIKNTSAKPEWSVNKFFIFNLAASAVMLMGISILYGISGSMDYYSISACLSAHLFNNTTLLLAALFILVGFASKMALFPFHFTVSKIIGSIPLSVFGMILCPVIISAFISAARFFITAFHSIPQLDPGEFTFYSLFLHPSITKILNTVGIITILISSIAIFFQLNLRRIIMFFVIIQSAMMILSMALFTRMGFPAALGFLISFCITFPGLLYFIHRIESVFKTDNIFELSGKGQIDKWTFVGLIILLLSMAGIPVTIGFAARMLIYNSMARFSYGWVIVISILSSLVLTFVCFRIFGSLFLKEMPVSGQKGNFSAGGRLILLIILLPAILVGFYFEPIIKTAEFFCQIYGIR